MDYECLLHRLYTPLQNMLGYENAAAVYQLAQLHTKDRGKSTHTSRETKQFEF